MKSKTQVILLLLFVIAFGIVLMLLNYFQTQPNPINPENKMSPEECLNQGGRIVNTVGGETCTTEETKIGNVIGFISPNICCAEMVGSNCGTVTPGNNDECCYRKLKENDFPKCLNILIFYNFETGKCDFTCGGSAEIACTKEAKQCPDGSWTSRTPSLNCSFIPCGFN